MDIYKEKIYMETVIYVQKRQIQSDNTNKITTYMVIKLYKWKFIKIIEKEQSMKRGKIQSRDIYSKETIQKVNETKIDKKIYMEKKHRKNMDRRYLYSRDIYRKIVI